MNRRLLLIAGLVAVLLVGAWYSLLYSPARGDLDDAQRRLTAVEDERDRLEIQKINLEQLIEQRPRLQSDIESLRAAVPERSGVADILLLVDEASRDAGLTFVNYASSEAGTADEFGLSTVQIQITGNGGYFQVLDFINRLTRIDRILVVDSISLTGSQDEEAIGPPIIDVTLGITSFVSGGEPAGDVQTTSADTSTTTSTTTEPAPEGSE